ncbi:restriction endonuclease subunit S [Methanomethylophilus alvi]|uniref:restriction endonuclease subunit S n=1 Tax=Methanomethylophilus alvi TaxID=1291540 RepID=UPI0037DCE0C3
MFGDLKQESPWESYKLSKLFDLTMGKTPSRDTPKYWSNGVYPWVSISDITSSNGVINDTKEKISEDAVAESGIKQIDAGTVLMSFKLSIGKTALTKFPLYTNEAIVAFVPKKSEVINNSFLQEWIKEKNWNEGSNKAVKGATLNKATLKEMRIHIPPIRLQNQFADFVEQVNKSKRTYKRIFESFDNLVKSRFIELFDRYEKVPLTEMADITMGQSPDSSTYNDQGVGVPFFQGKSEFTDTFVQINKYCSEPKKMAKKMDILMSVRAPVGAVNLTNQECCIGRGLAAITPKDEITDVWFLFNALRIMEQQISDMGVGSTFTAISKDDMKKIQIPAAPLPIQIQFSNFVEHIDKSKFIEAVEPYHPAVFQNVHGFPSFGLIST